MLKKGAAPRHKKGGRAKSVNARTCIGTGRYVAEHSVKKEAFGLEQHLVKYSREECTHGLRQWS